MVIKILNLQNVVKELLKAEGDLSAASANMGHAEAAIDKFVREKGSEIETEIIRLILINSLIQLYKAVMEGKQWAITLGIKDLDCPAEGGEIVKHFRAEIRNGHAVVTSAEPEAGAFS